MRFSSLLFVFVFLGISCFSENTTLPPPKIPDPGLSVSTNPSTVNIFPGTGELGEVIFQRSADSGVRLGGILVSDGDVTLTGGIDSKNWSGNNLIVIGLDLDFEKLNVWK